MVNYDLVVKEGRIITSHGVVEGNICINNGKIESIERSLIHTGKTIDATGLYIFPGLLDSHVHFRDPGLTHKEDFETGTKGAAAGGVTTIFDMPTTLPVVTNENLFREKLESVKKKAVVDFALFGAASSQNLLEIPKLAAAGAIGLKTYTVSPPKERIREYEGSFVTCAGQLLQVMEEVKKTNLVHCIHAEEDSTIACLTEKLQLEGRKDPMAHCESRPNFTEAEAVYEAVLLSEATGARVHIVHTSTGDAVEILKRAKSRGVKVTAETCPHYLYFSKDVLKEKGPYAKYNPPARNTEDTKALLNAINERTIDMVVTDHAPHSKEEKEKGREDIFKAPPGTPGVETRLPLLLSMVEKDLIPLETIPRITSESVARVFGLYPSKGTIAPGSSADLAIVDYTTEWKIKAADLQTKAWETVIFDGLNVKGRIKYTILAGEVAFEDGVGFGKQGTGRFVSGQAS